MIKRIYYIFFLLIVAILLSFDGEAKPSKNIKKAKIIASKKVQVSKKSTKKQVNNKKRRRIKAVRPVKMVYPADMEVVSDSALARGVTYKKILWGKKFQHHIHLIEYDRNVPGNTITVLKAGSQVNELQRLQDIISSHESYDGLKIYGATNANFWAAYKNTPIGPTIVNGEVLEYFTHKRWSAGFFDAEDRLFIDNYYLDGKIKSKKNIFEINSINRRKDSFGIVLYNKYAGENIPFIPNYKIEQEYEDALDEVMIENGMIDSTDIELDTLILKEEIMKSRQVNNIEYKLPKMTLIYLNDPALNRDVKCLVKKIDTGGVKMPKYGCIISVGRDISPYNLPRPGDTIIYRISTNVNENIEFINGVAGTPRLVREGMAKQEAIYEGSHGSRFIHQQLPRTAIGSNREGDKIYIVAVEPTSGPAKKAGADLQQLALIMKKLGAYNAMNLDGGGSSLMVINGKNVLCPTNPEHSRRISVGLGVGKIRISFP